MSEKEAEKSGITMKSRAGKEVDEKAIETQCRAEYYNSADIRAEYGDFGAFLHYRIAEAKGIVKFPWNS